MEEKQMRGGNDNGNPPRKWPAGQKLIVTIHDGTLLQKVNRLPKNVRGKVVEKALAAFFETPEGIGLLDIFKAPKETKGALKGGERSAKGVLGDFGE